MQKKHSKTNKTLKLKKSKTVKKYRKNNKNKNKYKYKKYGGVDSDEPKFLYDPEIIEELYYNRELKNGDIIWIEPKQEDADIIFYIYNENEKIRIDLFDDIYIWIQFGENDDPYMKYFTTVGNYLLDGWSMMKKSEPFIYDGMILNVPILLSPDKLTQYSVINDEYNNINTEEELISQDQAIHFLADILKTSLPNNLQGYNYNEALKQIIIWDKETHQYFDSFYKYFDL